LALYSTILAHCPYPSIAVEWSEVKCLQVIKIQFCSFVVRLRSFNKNPVTKNKEFSSGAACKLLYVYISLRNIVGVFAAKYCFV